MRRTILATILTLLIAPAAAAAQDALCPIDVTATAGDRWQVLVGDSIVADSLVSEHTQPYQALEVAMALETEDPTRVVAMDHRATWRVECPHDWTLPEAGVDTVLQVDTVRLAATDTLRSPYPVEAVGDSTGVAVTWNDLDGDADWFHFRAGMDGTSYSVWDTIPGTVGSHTITPPAADTVRDGWVCIFPFRAGVPGRRSCNSWTIPASATTAFAPDSNRILQIATGEPLPDTIPQDTSLLVTSVPFSDATPYVCGTGVGGQQGWWPLGQVAGGLIVAADPTPIPNSEFECGTVWTVSDTTILTLDSIPVGVPIASSGDSVVVLGR